MSYYINKFLSTELTCIPKIMDRLVGQYISNTIGNALTWTFIMWCILHYIFDECLNGLLKKMQFKQYVRKRLTLSIWYSGFYGTSAFFCLRSLISTNSSWNELRRNILLDNGPLQSHFLIALGLFATFFAHSAIWETLTYKNASTIHHYALTILPIIILYTRKMELFFTILLILSQSHFFYNLLRIIVSLYDIKKEICSKTLLYITFTLFFLGHILFVPILIIVPLIIHLLKQPFNPSLMLLIVVVFIWWTLEGFSNPLYRFVMHWLCHTLPDSNNKAICPGSIVECVLFLPRNDAAFVLELHRTEMKQRQDLLSAKKKPKSRGVLVQTLKCMVAIKRKLKAKTAETNEKIDKDSSDSDEDGVGEEDAGDSSSSASSSSEDDDERKQYKEETAKALIEDQVAAAPAVSVSNMNETHEGECENVPENKKND